MPDREKGNIEAFLQNPLAMTCIVFGLLMVGAATGIGPAAVSEPMEITLFGPDLFGRQVGQWLFVVGGVASMTWGLKLFSDSQM